MGIVEHDQAQDPRSGTDDRIIEVGEGKQQIKERANESPVV